VTVALKALLENQFQQIQPNAGAFFPLPECGVEYWVDVAVYYTGSAPTTGSVDIGHVIHFGNLYHYPLANGGLATVAAKNIPAGLVSPVRSLVSFKAQPTEGNIGIFNGTNKEVSVTYRAQERRVRA